MQQWTKKKTENEIFFFFLGLVRQLKTTKKEMYGAQESNLSLMLGGHTCYHYTNAVGIQKTPERCEIKKPTDFFHLLTLRVKNALQLCF